MELKSEKMQVKTKILIMWIIVVGVALASFCASLVDYLSYQKGQKFAVANQEIVQAVVDQNFFKKTDSYKTKCEKLYSHFSEDYPDRTINGVKYSNKKLRDLQDKMKESFEDVMWEAGFKRYTSYRIENWFKYTSFFQYLTGYSMQQTMFSITYILLLISLALSAVVFIIRQKEVVVGEKILICKYNKSKSKEIMIKDVLEIENTKRSLKLNGNGFKFKISLITNPEELKSAIMQKKDELEINDSKPTEIPITDADQIKKFKELLDGGIITEEEFESKKKQLLGL